MTSPYSWNRAVKTTRASGQSNASWCWSQRQFSWLVMAWQQWFVIARDFRRRHARGSIGGTDGHAVAGRSRAVWPVADRLWPVPPLATRRHLGKGPIRATGRGGRGRAGHLGCQRGLHRRPGAPARGRGAQKGDLQKEPPDGVGGVEPADHALGRSRGGWTTKLHLGCEQGRKPLSILLTAGQRGDSPQFTAVLERIRVPRPGCGRPRTPRTGCWATRRTARKA